MRYLWTRLSCEGGGFGLTAHFLLSIPKPTSSSLPSTIISHPTTHPTPHSQTALSPHHQVMSQVPWTRIREFKEEQERKKRREFEAALGRAQFQVPGQQGQQQQGQGQAPAQAKPFSECFKEAYFKERLMFGGVVGAVTGAFFGGRKCLCGVCWAGGGAGAFCGEVFVLRASREERC